MKKLIYFCDVCTHEYLNEDQKIEYRDKDGKEYHVCMRCEGQYQKLKKIKETCQSL